MSRIFVTLIFSFMVQAASSQRVYFVYLQTEPPQPFFVKMGDKVYNSTASGYLVLPKMIDSTYLFSVGFTGGKEYRFSCAVNKKDHGFLIKDLGAKGWGLYDLQTTSMQMAISDENKAMESREEPVSAFTELLSKAANDSTLKQKTVAPPAEETKQVTIKQEQVKQPEPVTTTIPSRDKSEKDKQESFNNNTPVAEIVNTESVIPNVAASVKTTDALAIKEVSVAREEITARSKVIRKSESSTTDGFGLTYIDVYENGRQDTIVLLIPNNETVKLAEPAPVQTPVVEKAKTVVSSQEIVKSVPTNNCKATATDDDFFKLRKKMAAEKGDEGMLNEAEKVFRNKCFTSVQIKNLSVLFIGDGGKYRFFDAAYAHVSDAENFSSLVSELKDEYFIKRFNAMLR